MRDLETKVAVVTGAASGIGRALASECAARGMRVVVSDISETGLEAVAAELEGAGTDVVAIPVDVASQASVEALAERVMEHFGAVHLVCNNAGIGGGALSWETDLDEWRQVMDVDFWGVVHGVNAFVPIMLEQGEGGHVVNTASMAGVIPGAGMAAYRAAKFAVVALSETLFHDLDVVGADIGVTVLCPGWVRTPLALGPGLGGDRSQAAALFEQATTRVVQTEGIDPTTVAAMVLDAVVEGRLYVLTHPQWDRAVTRRAENMITSRNPRLDPLGQWVKEQLAGS